MGQIKKQQPVNPVRNFFLRGKKNYISNGVKLIIGFIFKKEDILERAKAILEKKFAKIDFQSQTLPFNHTRYYEKEFGKNLKRNFISFRKLINPSDLAKIKIITNQIEQSLATGLNRTINIDPGYLNLSKLCLASTKDYKHRIYLNKGIFVEITLFYQDRTFNPWDWTYPDYKTNDYIAIFNQIREIYAQQIKGKPR